METQKPLLKDEGGEKVDVHIYRSIIGSLMYLTSSRPDIMFAVCACARYQVNSKVSHLYAVKRIFRYLKGQPKLGLWYPKDSPFDLVAYTNSDYAGASLDRKSTIGGGGTRRQETIGDTISQTSFENVSKHSNDQLLARGSTLQSGEDSLKLIELVEFCTNLQQRVLDLEKTKTTQQIEIDSLKRRVKKLKKKRSSRTHKLKRLYKVGLSARVESSRDEEHLDDVDNEMFDVNTLTGDKVLAEQEVTAKDVNLSVDEVTLDQALEALKSVKPKVKWDVIEEPSVLVSDVSASTKVSAATTTTAIIPTPRKGIVITDLGTPTIIRSSQQPSQAKVQEKGKGKMVEPEKPMKKKDQISFNEETALKLQAEFDEEVRLAREKDEANVALTEEWDDIQAKIEANNELAQRL
ncbi:hypothetical protein Tco_1509668 [Tanacetum coccineum]